MLAYLMVVKKDSREAIAYLHANDNLVHFYLNQGQANYHFAIGSIYRYSQQYDSAIHYYSLAAPELEKKFDPAVKMYFYQELGESYFAIGKLREAFSYFSRTKEIAVQQKEYSLAASMFAKLADISARNRNYEDAFNFNQQQSYFRDTLQKLSAERDMVLLEMERENNRHEKDLARQQEELRRRTNLQYMGISISITLVFLMMMVLGMFPLSRIWFRIISFFAFVCLFEFIILLIDNWVHHALHGDALQIWLFKTGLLAILLPLHHYLDHVMFVFLSSQKLMKMREKISLVSLRKRMQKKAPAEAEAVH